MKTNLATRPGRSDEARRTASAKQGLTVILLWLAVSVGLPLSAVRAETIYLVADNFSAGAFGSLDVATGQFTKVSPQALFFYSLAIGPNGLLYGGDLNYGRLYTSSTSGKTGPYGSVDIYPGAFFGLVYLASSDSFLAVDLNEKGDVLLCSISGDGNSLSTLGTMRGPGAIFIPAGDLALGPDQKLYFNYSLNQDTGADATLYTVNPSDGALTAVGSLGTNALVLFTEGATLYGIDATVSENIGIYTIDTASGAATQISTVTGLPSGGYYVDGAAVSTATVAPPPTVPTVTVAASSKTLVEGGGKVKIVFTRSGSDTTNDLTVNYKLGGTATNGVDYGGGGGQALATSITIPAGATRAKHKVFAFADGKAEGTETLKLKLAGSPTEAYTVGSPKKVKIAITDAP